jgi:3-hydroxyacyl-[acyl-carrier-protein] dehydratase
MQPGERIDQEGRQLFERHADRGNEIVAADGRALEAIGYIGEMMSESDRLDIEAIMRQLPHRYPFLLVDRVLECVAGQHCVALKNVTFNEPFFPGHFPHRPVMPGVLIIEALAQAAGILAFKTAKVVPDINTRFYFVAIDNARFRKPVEPGDQLMLRVVLKRAFKGIWKFHCLAEVEGKEVASAEIMVAPETKPPKPAGAAG